MRLLSNILTLVLLAHLLVATSGVPLVYHFCGGEMDSVSLGSAKKCDCQHEETESDDNTCCEKDCCHDELTVNKLDLNILLSSTHLTSELLATPLLTTLPFVLRMPTQEPVHSFGFVEHSPPLRHLDIPILFRSLLI